MSKPDYWTSSVCPPISPPPLYSTLTSKQSQAYKSSASFVPLLTTKVLTLLSPQQGEHILDLGCGDGQLTARLSPLVGPSGRVLGLDASQSMIDAASKTGESNVEYAVHDCSDLQSEKVGQGEWDAVFSNAALHWILRSERAREGLFGDVARALKKGGRMVFEMGGKGNVAEVNTALVAAVVDVGGVSVEEARGSVPWFFPSEAWMRESLEGAGLEVRTCELEYRPTKLDPEGEKGSGGLEGWVRLMGAQILAVVEEGKRDAVVKRVAEVLRDVITREEDGSQWIGYVRLRAEAFKP